jgi:hypothetical protein
MSDQPFEPDDAFEFTGVGIPTSREEAQRAQQEMAQCFIEEYVRMGYSGEFIMRLCRNPFYRGLHSILLSRGEAYVQGLIDDTLRQWRPHAQRQGQAPRAEQGGS